MSQTWQDIRESTSPLPLEPGQMIVGYRFKFAEPDLEDAIRLGLNRSFVTRAMPISGPIFFQFNHHKIGHEGWARYVVVCVGCGEHKYFKIRTPAARSWAHNHRCKFRLEIQTAYKIYAD